MAKKKEVTNEMLLKAIVAVNTRIDGLATKVGGLEATLGGLENKVGNLVTKGEFGGLQERVATEKHMKALIDELEVIGQDVETLNDHCASKEDLTRAIKTLATKEDVYELMQRVRFLDRGQDEVLGIVIPLQRAVDRNSEALIEQDVRLRKLEKHPVLSK